MRKIKAQGSYPKKQARLNLAKAALCILVLVLGAALLVWRLILTWQFGLLEQVALVLLLAPLGGFYYYQRRYRIFCGGVEGEKQVSQLLSRSLSDDYILLNDVYLGAGGDVDHVVLAPSGIFVLETKNWSGKIVVVEDLWHRPGKGDRGSSPSRQAKQNAAKIKRLIDTSPSLRGLEIMVAAVVVLTNRHATVQLNSPTVPVLRLQQLPNYIKTYGGQRRYSADVLEKIGREIAAQKV